MKHFHALKRRELRDLLMAGALAVVVTSVGSFTTSAYVRHPSAKPEGNHFTPGRGANVAAYGGKLEARRSVRQKLLASPIISRKAAKPQEESSTSGIASIYSDHKTASGEIMDSGQMTAAHRTLPFGTRVTVVNRSNGRSAVVRINDRGPFVRGRVIDLSPAAARALGVNGLASVSLIVGSREVGDDAKTAAADSTTRERVSDDRGLTTNVADAVAQ